MLTNLDVLSTYQFGLVAVGDDRLKKHGFSAKILDYVSYGLPTLVPNWHKIHPKIDGCIYFDETNFISRIEDYLDKNKWKGKSGEAYEYAQQHSWDKTLKPLLCILDKSLR